MVATKAMTIPNRKKRKFLRDAREEKEPKQSLPSKCGPSYPSCNDPSCNDSKWRKSHPCQSRPNPDSKVCCNICNGSMWYLSNDNIELQPDLLPPSPCDLAGNENHSFHSDYPTELTHCLQGCDNYCHCNFTEVPDVFGELVVVTEPAHPTDVVKSFQNHNKATCILKTSFTEVPGVFGDLVIVPERNVSSSDLMKPQKPPGYGNQNLMSTFTEAIDAFGEWVIVPEGMKHGRGGRNTFVGISPLKRVASEAVTMVTKNSFVAELVTNSSLTPTTDKVSESPPTEIAMHSPFATASKPSRDLEASTEALVHPTFDSCGRVIIYVTDSDDDSDDEEQGA